MDKADLIKYGTIALILLFGVEVLFFGVNSNPYPNATPTPTASPRPPQAQAFAGTGTVQGKVLNVSDSIIVACDSQGNFSQVRDALQEAGLRDVVFRSANTITATATEEGFEDKVRASLSVYCEPQLLRIGFVEVGAINVTNDKGESRMIPASTAKCLSSASGQCFAALRVGARAGQAVQLAVYAELAGSVVSRLIAEQSANPTLELKTAEANATVVSLGTVWIGMADIEWENRSFNDSELKALVNASAELLQYSYEKDDTVLVRTNATNGSVAALSQAFLGAAAADSGNPASGILVKVQANESSRDEVRQKVEDALKFSAGIEFPKSRLSFAANYTRGEVFEDAGISAPTKIEYKRSVIAALIDRAAASEELGAEITEENVEAYLSEPQVGSNVTLKLTALVQDGQIVSLQAVDVA